MDKDSCIKLPLIIHILTWVGISIGVATLLVDFSYYERPIPEIVKHVSGWLMHLSIIFILFVPFWWLEKLPTILKIKILFSPGLVVFFSSAHLYISDLTMFGIDLSELFSWCGTPTLIVSVIFEIIYNLRRKRTKEAVGK